MGQQQLLLLVLGIVIVGLAVVVGIDAFEENARKSTIDRLTTQATGYAGQMLEWKMKPRAQGGGQGATNMTGISLSSLGLSSPENITHLGNSDGGWAASGDLYVKLFFVDGNGMAPHVSVYDPVKAIDVSVFVFGNDANCLVHRVSYLDGADTRIDTPTFNPDNPNSALCSL